VNAYIDQNRSVYGALPICKVLQVAPSAYRRTGVMRPGGVIGRCVASVHSATSHSRSIFNGFGWRLAGLRRLRMRAAAARSGWFQPALIPVWVDCGHGIGSSVAMPTPWLGAAMASARNANSGLPVFRVANGHRSPRRSYQSLLSLWKFKLNHALILSFAMKASFK